MYPENKGNAHTTKAHSGKIRLEALERGKKGAAGSKFFINSTPDITPGYVRPRINTRKMVVYFE